MKVFSKVTKTEIEARPIVDGQGGKLLGFQESDKGPIMPVELYQIPFAIDWDSVRHETLMAVLPGIASRRSAEVKSNAKVSRYDYSTAKEIVDEATKVADELVRLLQENDNTFFSMGVEAIRKERSRQVSKEGFDAKHDMDHKPEDFARAAIAYLYSSIGEDEKAQEEWPFDKDFFKPKDDVRDIERAGALVAAGLDMLYSKLAKNCNKQTK